MKTFYSLEDIESLVGQGMRELIVDEDSVLTDVAQEAASRMGLKLVTKGRATTATVSAASAPTSASGARPRGCQHGPLAGQGPLGGSASGGQQGAAAQPKPAGSATAKGVPPAALVDDLVGAVKQMTGKATVG